MWDFKLKKRAPKPKEPVCYHSWRLLDMRMVEPSDWTPHIDEIEYEIACETCGKRRKLGEYAYEKFTEVFAVKGGREDAPH